MIPENLKCRNCEWMIVANVNKDYSRGSGTCAVRKRKRHIGGVFFCNTTCKDFIPRTSTLEVGEGENFKKERKI